MRRAMIGNDFQKVDAVKGKLDIRYQALLKELEKVMRLMFLFSGAIVFLGCNTGRPSKGQALGAYNYSVESIDSVVASADTSFFEFFENFMWDQDFQKSRVLFPFSKNDNSIETSASWEYLTFYTKHAYIPCLSSDTLSVFDSDVKSDETEMFIVDFDNAVADRFTFKKLNAIWHLQRIEKQRFNDLPDNKFLDFLLRFSTDTAFQVKHIEFPLSGSIADPGKDYETVFKTISLEDWEFWQATDEINGLMVLSDIQTDHRLRSLFFRGVENGIWVKYTFEKSDGEWKLVRFEDHST